MSGTCPATSRLRLPNLVCQSPKSVVPKIRWFSAGIEAADPRLFILSAGVAIHRRGANSVATQPDISISKPEKFAICDRYGLVLSVVTVLGLLALFATPVIGVCIVSDNRTHWMPATTRLRRLVGRGGPKPQPGDDSFDEYRRTRAGPRTSARHLLPPPGGGPTL
jgi:hypothetical protein